MKDLNQISATYISLFNAVFSDKWDSFLAVTKGISDTQAVWVPTCYNYDVETTPGWPLNGCVLWFGNHILANKVNYLQTVIDLHDRSEVSYEPIFDLAVLMKESILVHSKFISVLEKVKDSDYEIIVSDSMSLKDHMNNAIRHEAWHSGQIAVINRLFLERNNLK